MVRVRGNRYTLRYMQGVRPSTCVFGVVGREQALPPRRVLDRIRRPRGMPRQCFREIQRGIEGSDSYFPGKRNQLGRAGSRLDGAEKSGEAARPLRGLSDLTFADRRLRYFCAAPLGLKPHQWCTPLLMCSDCVGSITASLSPESREDWQNFAARHVNGIGLEGIDLGIF